MRGGEARGCPRCAQLDVGIIHMTWGCALLQKFWETVLAQVNVTLGRQLTHMVEICLLGLFPRLKAKQVGSRFVDLALVLARRQIARSWKTTTGPSVIVWEKTVDDWARVEERAIQREEARGIRKHPIAELRTEILRAWGVRKD